MDLKNTCDDPSSVTVVGNGPLSDEDRKQINESGCVIRFNDMKNFVEGDKGHLWALRDQTLRYAQKGKKGKIGDCLHYNFKKSTCYPTMPVLPVVSAKTSLTNLAKMDNVTEPIFIHQKRLKQNNIIEDAVLFEGCSESLRHSDARSGPSTGGAVIDFLQKLDVVEKINVYGMNWNGGLHHIDFANPDVVKKCCTKCDIHDTSTETYFP